MQCKACRGTITLGSPLRSAGWKEVNSDIVELLVNAVSLTGVHRKTMVPWQVLYDRIDQIHHQMVSFERRRLQQASGVLAKKSLWLSTDQFSVTCNWHTQERRVPVWMPVTTTADNLSGFVLRTDLAFDPGVGNVLDVACDLFDQGDFRLPLSRSERARFSLPSLVSAARFEIDRLFDDPSLSPDERRYYADLDDVLADAGSDGRKYELVGAPKQGVVTSKVYSATAHLLAVSQMLPFEAGITLSSDDDAAIETAVLTAMLSRIRAGRFDYAKVSIDKDLSKPKKDALVGAYQAKLKAFAEAQVEISGFNDLLDRFVRTFASAAERPPKSGQIWRHSPIQRMYEPNKRVAVRVQRPGTEESVDGRYWTMVRRASLHGVDTFFNMLRNRVSMVARPGLSRSTKRLYSNKQTYRPEIAAKVIDIARVYYNFVEPRKAERSEDYLDLFRRLDLTGHQRFALLADIERIRAEERDLERRPEKRAREKARRLPGATPAMRLGIANGPVELRSILYEEWRTGLSF